MLILSFLLVFFDCLCFSIRLQGKTFLARSIDLYLVDNQRSSGVVLAGI
jgi:hypothetical protein